MCKCGNVLYELTINPNTMVEKNAPRNPSHVFFGERLISFVRPKKNPVKRKEKNELKKNC